MDVKYNIRVALKKLARPFQSSVHALRTYRELRYLKHMKHENVREFWKPRICAKLCVCTVHVCMAGLAA